MGRIVRLTELDLTRLVRRIVRENHENQLYSDIMGLITNSNSSHEETISILNSIVDEMSSSRKLRRDVEKRFRDDDYTQSNDPMDLYMSGRGVSGH
jgi:hydrogenase maturation factor HypE